MSGIAITCAGGASEGALVDSRIVHPNAHGDAAKTRAGLAARIAQRLLALTLGILLNTLTGRQRAHLINSRK
jgi:hypothetical protein